MIDAPVSVRAARDADIPFLRAMIWEALAASPTFLAEIGEDAARRYEDAYWAKWPVVRDPAFVARAVDGGEERLLGAIVIKPEGAAPLLRGWRFGIGIVATARRRGVGALLVRTAIDFARANGAAYLGLRVDVENRPAIALYERQGFLPVGGTSTVLEMRLGLV